jgi:hypothetical protein
VKHLVKRYGPWCSIWLFVLGHSAKPITIAKNNTTVFLKLAISFKQTVTLKSVCIDVNNTSEGLHHSNIKSLVSAKKFGSLQGPKALYGLPIRIAWRIQKKCNTAL